MRSTRLCVAAAAAAATWFYIRNHRRIRTAKSCLRAFALRPPLGVPCKPYPLLFLAGMGQKSSVWRGRMELLAAAGYECHALDFVQTGRYFTSMQEQVFWLRKYILEKLDGQPVLIGHSQGGSRAQCYMLAADGDASVQDEGAAVRAMVLMASNEASFVSSFPDILRQLIATAGVLRAMLAGLLGQLYLDPMCFSFGGGPWRHRLRMYAGLFNPQTQRTTLMSIQGVKDARIGWSSDAGELPLSVWADAYLSDHEPFMTDLGVVHHARSPSEALTANGCALLHLVAAEDRVMPRVQSQKVAAMWDTPLVTIGGQGHQFGDAGWEESTMRPLREFLDAL